MADLKIVFIDRDGVINEDPRELYYVHNWSEFRFVKDAFSSLNHLARMGYKLIVVSNQAGIGKGEVMRDDLDQITQNMLSQFKQNQIPIESVQYCYHKPNEGCACRKPKTGMFEVATRDYDLSESQLYMIGDTEKDMVAGKSFGCQTILVTTGQTSFEKANEFNPKPDFIAGNLTEAVKWIHP